MNQQMVPKIKIVPEELFREIEQRNKRRNYFAQPNKESIEKKLQMTGKKVNYELKTFTADLSDYVAQMMMLQFIHPLLQLDLDAIQIEFKKIMKTKYNVIRPRIGIYFMDANILNQSDYVEESRSLDILSERLSNKDKATYSIKNSDLTKKKLERVASNVMNEYEANKTSLELLAECFGRVKVIPVFYTYKNNKQIERYNNIVNQAIKFVLPIPDILLDD